MRDQFIIKTQEGYALKADGNYSEYKINVSFTDDLGKAKTFVSEKTAQRWADAYGLSNYSIHTLEHLQTEARWEDGWWQDPAGGWHSPNEEDPVQQYE